MPARGKRHPELDPNEPVSHVLTVDYAPVRVRLPKGITLQLSWLREYSKSLEVRAFPGPAGGLRIWPPDALQEQRAMLAVWKETDAELLRQTETTMEFARYQAAGWKMTLSLEPKVPRFTLYLSEDARKLTLLPQGGQKLVVCAMADVLELWTAEDWNSHNRSLARRQAEIIRETREILGLDEEE